MMNFRRTLVLVGLLMWATVLRAEPIRGAGSLSDGPGAYGLTHGWFVLPQSSPPGATVVHVPPRIWRDRTGVNIGAPAGSVRFTTELRSAPVQIAAHENRLYMAFEERVPGFPPERGRTVLSIAAVASGESWTTSPVGRLDAHPSLRADGSLLGLAASRAGVFALMHGLVLNGEDPTRLALRRLAGDEWKDAEVPEELGEYARRFSVGSGGRTTTSAAWTLFSAPDGVGILCVPPAGESAPTLCFLADQAEDGAFRWRRIELPAERRSAGEPDEMWMLTGADHLVLCSKRGADVVVVTRPVAGGPWRSIATVEGVSDECGVTVQDGDGRLVFLWSVEEKPQERGTRAQPRRVVAEVSIRTGRELFRGDFGLTSPITRADYRLMAIVLLYAVGMIAVFILKSSADESVVVLPEGTSLAEPGRRFLAGFIDLLLAVVIASRVWKVPAAELLTIGVWTEASGQMMAITAAGLLVGMNSILEWIFGRSLGKLLVGCEVVVVKVGQAQGDRAGREIGSHPSLLRSVIRNVVKWCLPPLGLLGLVDESARHRGDHLAGTAVIVQGVEEESDDDAEE